MTNYQEQTTCRGCGEKFGKKIYLNLGDQEIVDFVEPGEKGRGAAPLQLVCCSSCSLVQLRHTVDHDILFKKFWYRSSINERMREALRDIVVSAKRRCELKPTDWVLDIGTNDGELLLNYDASQCKIGFEPAKELAQEADKRLAASGSFSHKIIENYFNSVEALIPMVTGSEDGLEKYRIITAAAMFYDLQEPLEFLYDVKAVLKDGGMFIVQMNYLRTMIRGLAFDNVSHEHLCYYDLTSLKKLVEKAGLKIFDVELNDVNAGSFRVYIDKGERKEGMWVRDLLALESLNPIESELKHFSERVEATSRIILSFLTELQRKRKQVYVYGASTRGLTLLQTIFKNVEASKYLIAAAERDEKKYGKRMVGVDIPIVDEKVAREKADYMLVLPYHFWPAIKDREAAWMKERNGKFIIPLPYPKVVAYHENFGLVATDLTQELDHVA